MVLPLRYSSFAVILFSMVVMKFFRLLGALLSVLILPPCQRYSAHSSFIGSSQKGPRPWFQLFIFSTGVLGSRVFLKWARVCSVCSLSMSCASL